MRRVAPVPVVLVDRLLGDLGAGGPSALAVGVDILVDQDVDAERLLAEVFRVPVRVARVAHVDRCAVDPGLGVIDVALLAGVAEHLFEAERIGEELQHSVAVLVQQVRSDDLLFHQVFLLRRRISVSRASSRFVQKHR